MSLFRILIISFLYFSEILLLWIAWRGQFASAGFGLGLIAMVGGMMFLVPFLLIIHVKANGEMQKFLMGKRKRASA